MVQVLGDPKEHFWLMLGMARSLDVDLSAAMADGRLTPADFAGMHTRCRTCSEPGACRKLLDARLPLEDPPVSCRNGAALEALKGAK